MTWDMAYGHFKDLTRRTVSEKNCVIKHLILLKIQNMMNIKRALLQWSIKCLIKKLQVEQLKIKI